VRSPAFQFGALLYGVLMRAYALLFAAAVLITACGESASPGGSSGASGSGNLSAAPLGQSQCSTVNIPGYGLAADRFETRNATCDEARGVVFGALQAKNGATTYDTSDGWGCTRYRDEAAGADPVFGQNGPFLFSCRKGDKYVAFAYGYIAGYGPAYPSPSPSAPAGAAPGPQPPAGDLAATQPGYGQCGYQAFTDGNVAAQIAKEGTDCKTAQQVADRADAAGAGNDFTTGGFACHVYGKDTAGDDGNFGTNPYWFYTCSNGSVQVAFTFGKQA